jgi:hypothetical protein
MLDAVRADRVASVYLLAELSQAQCRSCSNHNGGRAFVTKRRSSSQSYHVHVLRNTRNGYGLLRFMAAKR